MDFETLGHRLNALRKARNLTQVGLAALVGVPQGLYSLWETGAQAVPIRHVPTLAGALGVDVGVLAEVHAAAEHGPRRLPVFLTQDRKRSIALPPYDIVGSIEEMLNLGDVAVDLLCTARERLSPADLARLDHRFPRDSAWELLAAFHALGLGGYLSRLTLAQLYCPVLVVDAYRSTRSGAHFLRDVIVLERPKFAMIMIPQTWVVSVVQGEWYRLDFLCYVRGAKGDVRWAYLEINGAQHEWQVERDKHRAWGISAPRLAFWAREVMRRDFGERAVARLATLLEQEPPSFVYPLPKASATGVAT